MRAHGFSARTTTALVGHSVWVDLDRTAWLFRDQVGARHWVASEDDYVLAAAAPDLRLTSVVICGIIVAGLGVLNDVTITQASQSGSSLIRERAGSTCSPRHADRS
jgi:uncharacterized membrane protein